MTTEQWLNKAIDAEKTALTFDKDSLQRSSWLDLANFRLDQAIFLIALDETWERWGV
tara:strand:+ start:139 stop:309 length:171 start_codon:yes stop_codon:yes gene_type:complete